MDAAQTTASAPIVVDKVAEEVKRSFRKFLNTFTSDEDGGKKYVKLAHEMVGKGTCTLPIGYGDLQKYDTDLLATIQEEFANVFAILCAVVKEFVEEMHPTAVREYQICIVDVPALTKIRELSAAHIGQLVRIQAQIVRTHPVHPELVIGTFRCRDCNTVIRNVEQQFKYTEPTVCFNPKCGNRSTFELISDESKFIDFQKVRAQETQAEVPRGTIPRSLEIILHGEQVESAQPGDRSEIVGCFIVIPDVAQIAIPGRTNMESKVVRRNEGFEKGGLSGVSGLKSLGVRELNYRVAFLACHVQSSSAKFQTGFLTDNQQHISYDELSKHMREEEVQELLDMSKDTKLFEKMCDSLFPTIYGCMEVKKGILLMLFGGVPKVTEELTRLRGDINVCIVGDPSTAKSQLLKHVERFYPERVVYTSGKASSAAGLTAAVVRDEETGEFVIEAGALMLADHGVCCIDEFDKMDLSDQVAIHEAMEQQTISIMKAGVRGTLHARTSILAAANPIGGRYDRTRSLRQNIAMSAPIMSRFDLFFVLTDQCDPVADYAIARSITNLHLNSGLSGFTVPYSQDAIRRYIAVARCFKPQICVDAMQSMVEFYKKMRQRDATAGSKSAWRVTVRQLESLIRLSEALARLHCTDFVTKKHVEEAYNLLNKSIIRVEQPAINFQETEEEVAIRPTDVETQTAGDEAPPTNGDAMEIESHAGGEAKLQLSYDDYQRIAKLLLWYCHHREESASVAETEEVENVPPSQTGPCTLSQLIAWYLEEVAADMIESENDLLQQKRLVERVIHRLVNTDHVLIKLRQLQSGLEVAPEAEKEDHVAEEEDPILVVHPNYMFE